MKYTIEMKEVFTRCVVVEADDVQAAILAACDAGNWEEDASPEFEYSLGTETWNIYDEQLELVF